MYRIKYKSCKIKSIVWNSPSNMWQVSKMMYFHLKMRPIYHKFKLKISKKDNLVKIIIIWLWTQLIPGEVNGQRRRHRKVRRSWRQKLKLRAGLLKFRTNSKWTSANLIHREEIKVLEICMQERISEIILDSTKIFQKTWVAINWKKKERLEALCPVFIWVGMKKAVKWCVSDLRGISDRRG